MGDITLCWSLCWPTPTPVACVVPVQAARMTALTASLPAFGSTLPTSLRHCMSALRCRTCRTRSGRFAPRCVALPPAAPVHGSVSPTGRFVLLCFSIFGCVAVVEPALHDDCGRSARHDLPGAGVAVPRAGVQRRRRRVCPYVHGRGCAWCRSVGVLALTCLFSSMYLRVWV